MATTPRPVVCVFCGANPGNSPAYIEAARALARTFAEHDIHLVYGGGTSGMMGELARTLVSLSGPEAVEGIIPRELLRTERSYDAATASAPDAKLLIDERRFGRTTVVEDMHTRKRQMKDAVVNGGPGSGFVTLPGGYGTFEELMEMVTWNQLGIHAMPIVLFNVEGYWDGVLQWVQKAVDSGFVGEKNSTIIAEAKTSEEVVEKLRNYVVAEGRFKLSWGTEG